MLSCPLTAQAFRSMISDVAERRVTAAVEAPDPAGDPVVAAADA